MTTAAPWTILLIIHAVVGTALLGALTHQASAVLLPLRQPAGFFANRFRSVLPASYASAIVYLYVTQFLLGAQLYIRYFVSIRPAMEEFDSWKTIAAFDVKVNAVTLGLSLVPAYWYFWTQFRTNEVVLARKWLTVCLAMIVWYAFIVGHLAVNVRGMAY